MTSTNRSPRRLTGLVLAAVLLTAGCANSAEPNGWDEQADSTGRGLAERNFLEACIEANDDLPAAQGEAFCECVLVAVQEAVTYGKFKELDDHIRKNGDEITASGLAEGYPWFGDAVGGCS